MFLFNWLVVLSIVMLTRYNSEGFYSPEANHYGSCLELYYKFKLSSIPKQKIISIMHSSIHWQIWLNFMALCFGIVVRFQFEHFFLYLFILKFHYHYFFLNVKLLRKDTILGILWSWYRPLSVCLYIGKRLDMFSSYVNIAKVWALLV
jgi:hypothetical protein